MLELSQEFVAESREMIEEVEPLLMELEAAAENADLDQVDTIFRGFHSMKGTAGFLELDSIVTITHAAESLLDLFRKGEASLQGHHVTALCRAMDTVKDILTAVDETGSDDGFENPAMLVSSKLKEAAETAKGTAGDADPTALAIGAVEHAPKVAAEPSDPPTETAPPTEEEPSIHVEISPEMVDAFLRESTDLLDTAEESLLQLEGASGETVEEAVGLAFRDLHSFKGNCGFFGYATLEQISHGMESTLDQLRTGDQACTQEIVDGLLAGVDQLRKELACAGSSEPPSPEHTAPEPTAAAARPEPAPTEPVDNHLVTEPELQILLPGEPGAENTPTLESRLAVTALDEAFGFPAETAPETVPETAPATVATTAAAAAPPEPQQSPPSTAKPTQRKAAGGNAPEKSKGSIRVDLAKLDELMDLVGELIIAENMVTHHPELEGQELQGFQKASMQLNRITRSLHDVAMGVRMVPIGGTFKKMIRLVRDVSKKVGKHVELEMEGEHTEIDKTVAEAIADPLVHMIRNSVDHGIESPEDRKAAGKTQTGTIHLSACHEGNEIWIRIRDDGKGLDKERILAKAIKNGVVLGDGSDMSDGDIYKLIFEAGLSTADQLSDISGRGVGMDVVRRNIENLKGRIEVDSTSGKGSLFTIRLPLTLAIIEGMLLRVGEATYTLPLLNIHESMRPRPEQISTLTDGTEMVNIRGSLIPILRLHRVYNLEPDTHDLHRGILVIVADEQRRIALFVDEILGQRQTVIKAMPDCINDVRGLTGCSILNDGDISLILDIGDLAAHLRSQNASPVEVGAS